MAAFVNVNLVVRLRHNTRVKYSTHHAFACFFAVRAVSRLKFAAFKAVGLPVQHRTEFISGAGLCFGSNYFVYVAQLAFYMVVAVTAAIC